MELSIGDESFLDSFEHINTYKLDKYEKNVLDLFMLRVNANEFDYNTLIENLLEPMATFSLSRKTLKDYADKPVKLTRKAKEKFIESVRNTGELGELLLYAFLECHLNAPKILSKLELKTSTSMYVFGADGVHYLKLPNGNYQLIFGEAKTMANLGNAINEAITSIYNFKNEVNGKGNSKSGITYEKRLISDNIFKESLADEDIDFLTALIYPKKENVFKVDDAFGIFIGYETKISKEDKMLPNDKFLDELKSRIITEVNDRLESIQNKILEKDLHGHSFYIYVLPFTDLDGSRTKIIEGVTR